MLRVTTFILLVLCLYVSFGNGSEDKPRVAIACEHSKHKSVKCPRGHVIKVVIGFYGRIDKTTCRGGNVKNTHCFARNSEMKLSLLCHDKPSCLLKATNHVFGDPCHGTRKYIKLIYVCVKQQRPPQCRRPNEPDNGSIRPPRGDLFNPGQKIWFSCDRGFDLVGHKDFRCQKDGSWSPSKFPTCNRPIQCRRPNQPDNGSIRPPTGDVFTPGQKIWFDCDRGFDLVGHKDFRCQDDGNWSPKGFPTCNRPTQCRRPNEPDNGSIRPPKGDLFNPGQKIWFSCDRGFDLVGHKDFRCQDDGNWSPHEFPRCDGNVAIVCEHSGHKSVKCPRGHIIKIVRGFYGRDDKTTCRGGNVRNTNCFARNSEKTLRHLCEDRSNCLLEASNRVFGDPCHGVRKYIKLVYYCKKH